jgi:hypothetical protein
MTADQLTAADQELRAAAKGYADYSEPIDSLQAAALRFAAGLLTGAPADDLRRRAAELDGQPLCKGGWRAGIIAPPGSEGPPDGARCTYADKHPGWCSFIDEAIGRGWVPPAGLIPRRPA